MERGKERPRSEAADKCIVAVAGALKGEDNRFVVPEGAEHCRGSHSSWYHISILRLLTGFPLVVIF